MNDRRTTQAAAVLARNFDYQDFLEDGAFALYLVNTDGLTWHANKANLIVKQGFHDRRRILANSSSPKRLRKCPSPALPAPWLCTQRPPYTLAAFPRSTPPVPNCRDKSSHANPALPANFKTETSATSVAERSGPGNIITAAMVALSSGRFQPAQISVFNIVLRCFYCGKFMDALRAIARGLASVNLLLTQNFLPVSPNRSLMALLVGIANKKRQFRFRRE
ncbi:hypothetical protein [Mesorhizobium sp. 113-3-3]|uniref:hypothetical protein n=1 Tax=Mesorhizobium sp. 113-3-3 TaxID=2744516 RepID=UPI0018EB8F17|nr:hypothetical protein [Mesorhizobium sp. 113-3-3]